MRRGAIFFCVAISFCLSLSGIEILVGNSAVGISMLYNDDLPPNPRGFGGWMIMLSLGLIFVFAHSLSRIWTEYLPVFQPENLNVYTLPASEYFVPYISGLLFAELALSFLFSVALAFLLILLFKRSRYFPRLFVFTMLSHLILLTAIALIFDAVTADIQYPDEIGITEGEFYSSIYVTVVWGSYVLLSRRVYNTFLRKSGAEDQIKEP